MTVTFGVTVTADGGGAVNNNGGRRVLMAKTDSLSNVNNNNNNNGPAATASNTGKASVLSVRRVLFGPPADPAETRAWLDRQLYAATAADSRSWNFDFVNERPMRDSPTDRYAWERVCPPTPQHQQRNDEADDATATTTEQQRNCRRTSGKQRQSKVTDFMSKAKKRPQNVAGTLRSNNKIVDDELAASGNKRSRRSTATMAI